MTRTLNEHIPDTGISARKRQPRSHKARTVKTPILNDYETNNYWRIEYKQSIEVLEQDYA